VAPAVGADGGEAGDLSPPRPWRAWATDYRELAATRRARRLAVVLMALSSLLTVSLLAAAWLLVRSLF
jgi:hypothetical protein